VLEVLAITVAVLLGLALAGWAAFAAVRLRQRQANRDVSVPASRQVPRRAAEPLSAPRRPAIVRPQELHVHFHGVSAEDVAAILAERNRPGGPRV
jgi:hypothetical protein